MKRNPRTIGDGSEHGPICMDCRNSGMRDDKSGRFIACECGTPVVRGLDDPRGEPVR